MTAQAASHDGRRVLGIDPGTTITGWGVVATDGNRLSRIASGALRLRGDRATKLNSIFSCVAELCADHTPDAVSLEQTFVGDNIQTALRLGEARGSVMVAVARAGITVCEYSPAAIKLAVAGSGRADKTQMMAMVARLLGITTPLQVDEADALGAAICHVNTSRFDAKIAGAPAVGSRAGARASRWR